MAVWEQATLSGDRIDIDGGGGSWVRILSPSFRLNDGNDYTFIGFGNQFIQSS